MQLFVLCISNMCRVYFTVRKRRQNGNEENFSKIKCLSVSSSSEVKSLEHKIITIPIVLVLYFFIHQETLEQPTLISKRALLR